MSLWTMVMVLSSLLACCCFTVLRSLMSTCLLCWLFIVFICALLDVTKLTSQSAIVYNFWIPWCSLVNCLTHITKFIVYHCLAIGHGNHVTCNIWLRSLYSLPAFGDYPCQLQYLVPRIPISRKSICHQPTLSDLATAYIITGSIALSYNTPLTNLHCMSVVHFSCKRSINNLLLLCLTSSI